MMTIDSYSLCSFRGYLKGYLMGYYSFGWVYSIVLKSDSCILADFYDGSYLFIYAYPNYSTGCYGLSYVLTG